VLDGRTYPCQRQCALLYFLNQLFSQSTSHYISKEDSNLLSNEPQQRRMIQRTEEYMVALTLVKDRMFDYFFKSTLFSKYITLYLKIDTPNWQFMSEESFVKQSPRWQHLS
jgi:hypothetical protein